MTHDTHRRTFLKGVGVTAGVGATVGTASSAASSSGQQQSMISESAEDDEKVKVAGITTVHRPNSHSDVQLGRLVQGFNLDGTGDRLEPLELASMYTDQVPSNDTSRELARRYNFPIFDSVGEAVTLGTGELAVDAVYLALEHGDYPVSQLGITEYPKRRIFEDVVDVFEATGEVVPVFLDKFLAPTWEDAIWIYEKAQELDIPLMAGSSLPVAWRSPWHSGQSPDVENGSTLEEAVVVGNSDIVYGGFHGYEFMQSLVENRAGGETGITSIQTLSGDAVWDAADNGVYDKELLLAALNRQSERTWTADEWGLLQDVVDNPVVGLVEYADGLKGRIFSLMPIVFANTAAWRYDGPDGEVESIKCDLQYARPYGHHGTMVDRIKEMFVTGEPTYPAERTLMTNGVLVGVLSSLHEENGARIQTPHLNFSYDTDWNWEQPDPKAPGRTVAEDFPANFPWHIPISFGESSDVLDARYDDGDLSNGQYNQLTAKLSTAEQKAKQGKADQANNALDQFIATASSVADGQTSSDLVEMAENLQENRVPELEEILA